MIALCPRFEVTNATACTADCGNIRRRYDCRSDGQVDMGETGELAIPKLSDG